MAAKINMKKGKINDVVPKSNTLCSSKHLQFQHLESQYWQYLKSNQTTLKLLINFDRFSLVLIGSINLNP